MMKIVIRESAKKDMQHIRNYLVAVRDVQTSNKHMNRMNQTIAVLEYAPDIGGWLRNRVDRETDYRYLVSGKYLIIYKIFTDKVCIIRVFDGRLDWKKILFAK